MAQEIFNTIYNLLPEITLALIIFTLTTISFFKNVKRNAGYLILPGFAVSLVFVIIAFYSSPKPVFSGLISIDPFSSILKICILTTLIILIFVFREKINLQSIIIPIILLALGSVCLVSSANLYFTFVSAEVISISIYLLLGTGNPYSFKYFVYSAVSSGIFLYGITLLYGLGGSADYAVISTNFSNSEINPLTLAISLTMIFTGFGFKMGLFPFNFIMPGLAEKINLEKLGFITIVPAVSVSGAIVRMLLSIFHDTGLFTAGSYQMLQIVNWKNLVILISITSVITGYLVINWQSNLKKIFIFILLSQAGFILLPLADSSAGIAGVILNLIAFTINLTGIIICLKAFYSNSSSPLTTDALKGAGYKSKFIIIAFIVFLVSSAGFPVTAGFTAKLYVYGLIFKEGYTTAGIILLLCTVTYLYFIFRIVSISFTKAENPIEIRMEPINKVILLIFLFLTIMFGIFNSSIIELSKYSSKLFGI